MRQKIAACFVGIFRDLESQGDDPDDVYREIKSSQDFVSKNDFHFANDLSNIERE